MKARILMVVACISLVVTAATAHGGEEHVIGTVSKVAADSITVKTGAKTMATVAVVPKTTFLTAKHAAKIADVQVGDRVVIHATEPVEGKLVADTVEFSAAKPATATPAAAAAAAAKKKS